MKSRLANLLAIFTASAIAVSAGAADAPESTTDAAKLQFFEAKVRPLLVENCYACHSANAKKLKANLLLDTPAGILKGGDSGPVIVPGEPDKSRLIDAIRYQNVDLQMPPKKKLADPQIADLTTWVRMGAPLPQHGADAAAVTGAIGFDLHKRRASHWSWQPVRPVPPPAVKHPAWPQSDIDRFILAKLEDKSLTPAPPADRRTLVRRVFFDLTGLPPTPHD